MAPGVAAIVIGLSAGRGLFWQRRGWVRRLQADASRGALWGGSPRMPAVRADRALAGFPFAGVAWTLLVAGALPGSGDLGASIGLGGLAIFTVLAVMAAAKPSLVLGRWYREPVVLRRPGDMGRLETALTLSAIVVTVLGMGLQSGVLLAIGIVSFVVWIIWIVRASLSPRINIADLEPGPDREPDLAPDPKTYPLNPH